MKTKGEGIREEREVSLTLLIVRSPQQEKLKGPLDQKRAGGCYISTSLIPGKKRFIRLSCTALVMVWLNIAVMIK